MNNGPYFCFLCCKIKKALSLNELFFFLLLSINQCISKFKKNYKDSPTIKKWFTVSETNRVVFIIKLLLLQVLRSIVSRGTQACGWSALREIFQRDPSPQRVSEKTTENSERLGRQACSGIEPGTPRQPVLRA